MAENHDPVAQADEETLYSFEKNEREKVKIRKTVFKGKEYLDIRIYVTGPQGEEIPTKKGINLPLDLAGELKKGIVKL